MKKVSFLLLFIAITATALSQKPAITPEEKKALDSMLKHDEFLKMMDSLDEDPGSYFDISVGLGNREFSSKNNSVNATQSSTKKLFFTPAIGYHHKSGLSISVMPYLSSDSGSLKLYQTAIIPSFDYIGDHISAGLAYTRFIADTKSYNSGSTYQNDFYGYIKASHGAIQPGLSIGYSSGNFKAIDTFTFTPRLPNGTFGTPRVVKDSTGNKIRDFSISASIEHDFNFYNIFNNKDGLTLLPQLMLIGGSEKLTTTHTNVNYGRFAKRVGKVRNRNVDNSSAFELQSAAFSLDLTYTVGKFFIEPNAYFDYYLPSSTEKRFTSIFTVTAGFTF